MTVGENIRRIRNEKGWTQKELGKRCGLADSAVRRYELGGANPKIETMKKIADALQVNVRELMEDDRWFRIESEMSQNPDCDSSVHSRLRTCCADCMRRFGQEPFLEIMEHLNTLNRLGQQEAFRCIGELAQMPEYVEKEI